MSAANKERASTVFRREEINNPRMFIRVSRDFQYLEMSDEYARCC